MFAKSVPIKWNRKLIKKAGSAIAEFAIVIPLTVAFLTGGFEAWRVIKLYDELEALALTAARFASLQDPPRSAIEQRTRNYIEHDVLPNTALAYLPHSDFVVSIRRLEGTEWDRWPYDTVSPGDALRVKILLRINAAGQFKSYFLNTNEIVVERSYVHLNDRVVGS